jgi:dihydropteroate synthase
VTDRREASLAAHALGIGLGCRILRAHDVRGSRRVADVMAAILTARDEAGDETDKGVDGPDQVVVSGLSGGPA